MSSRGRRLSKWQGRPGSVLEMPISGHYTRGVRLVQPAGARGVTPILDSLVLRTLMSEQIAHPEPPGGEFLFYQAEDGRLRLQVRVKQETVWLSLNQMAELFEREKSVISKHIKNVFEEGELKPEATVAEYATTQTERGRTVS